MSPYLFGPAGAAALARLASRPALYAFDFDGTLAPIVARPGDARMPAASRRPWARLCRRAMVAVLSGRGRADLAARLPTRPTYLIGNHGAEGVPLARRQLPRWAATCEAWAARLEERRPALPPGVLIERKRYTLSLHYRLAADQEAARTRLMREIAALAPAPRVIVGHCVLNLLPPGAPTKDRALKSLQALSGARPVLFVGDDETDEWAFRHAAATWLTVRVGPEGASAARFHLKSQREVARLLRLLARQTSRRAPGGDIAGIRAG
jgi:trehalose 6-phosphate phosphatase